MAYTILPKKDAQCIKLKSSCICQCLPGFLMVKDICSIRKFNFRYFVVISKHDKIKAIVTTKLACVNLKNPRSKQRFTISIKIDIHVQQTVLISMVRKKEVTSNELNCLGKKSQNTLAYCLYKF